MMFFLVLHRIRTVLLIKKPHSFQIKLNAKKLLKVIKNYNSHDKSQLKKGVYFE